MEALKREWRVVRCVKRMWTHWPKHPCICGKAPNVPGPVCMCTMLVPMKVPCFWYWLMHIWSGWKVYYAGSYEGSMFLILVDAYLKWMEGVLVRNATLQSTMEKLRILFTTHCLLGMLAYDNGSSVHQCRGSRVQHHRIQFSKFSLVLITRHRMG